MSFRIKNWTCLNLAWKHVLTWSWINPQHICYISQPYGNSLKLSDCWKSFIWHLLEQAFRGGSRIAAASKMERFVMIVNGRRQPLTIITKRSILDVAAALDLPLSIHSLINQCQSKLIYFLREAWVALRISWVVTKVNYCNKSTS